MSKKLNAIPSTGLLFLYFLKENKFILNKNNIFGFSFFDNKDITAHGNHHYYNIKTKKISSGILTSRHNWKTECLYFNKYILDK